MQSCQELQQLRKLAGQCSDSQEGCRHVAEVQVIAKRDVDMLRKYRTISKREECHYNYMYMLRTTCTYTYKSVIQHNNDYE